HARHAVDEIDDEYRAPDETEKRKWEHRDERSLVAERMLETAPIRRQTLFGEAIEELYGAGEVPAIVPPRGPLFSNAPGQNQGGRGRDHEEEVEGCRDAGTRGRGGGRDFTHQKNLNFLAAKAHMRSSSQPWRKRLMLVRHRSARDSGWGSRRSACSAWRRR